MSLAMMAGEWIPDWLRGTRALRLLRTAEAMNTGYGYSLGHILPAFVCRICSYKLPISARGDGLTCKWCVK